MITGSLFEGELASLTEPVNENVIELKRTS